MSCEHQDKILEAAEIIGRKIQEAANCNNPEYLLQSAKALAELTKALKDLPKSDADDKQYFDITSQAIT